KAQLEAKMSDIFRGLRDETTYPWRTSNLGRLFLMATINWQDALVQGLQEAGFPNVRSTHINLLRHIDLSGTRITEIAERAGITKQAVGQLVTACQKAGLVISAPDPDDRRAKVIMFTEQG